MHPQAIVSGYATAYFWMCSVLELHQKNLVYVLKAYIIDEAKKKTLTRSFRICQLKVCNGYKFLESQYYCSYSFKKCNKIGLRMSANSGWVHQKMQVITILLASLCSF